MKRIAFPLERLLGMPRPERYIHQVAGCALECTGRIIVDADSACYRKLQDEYAGYEPAPEELRRAERFLRQRKRGPDRRERLIQERKTSPGRTRAAGFGCGGCRGRNIRK